MNLFKFNFLQILGLFVLIFVQKNNALIINFDLPSEDQIKSAYFIIGNQIDKYFIDGYTYVKSERPKENETNYSYEKTLIPGKSYSFDLEDWTKSLKSNKSFNASKISDKNLLLARVKLKNGEDYSSNRILLENNKQYTISLPPCKDQKDEYGTLCIQSSYLRGPAKGSGGGGGGGSAT